MTATGVTRVEWTVEMIGSFSARVLWLYKEHANHVKIGRVGIRWRYESDGGKGADDSSEDDFYLKLVYRSQRL